jgi:hypothetical protein
MVVLPLRRCRVEFQLDLNVVPAAILAPSRTCALTRR